MKRLITICLVLFLASASYGSTLVTSFENPTNGEITSWGPTIIPGQTVGVTDGSYSVAAVCSVGFGFIGQINSGPNGNSCNAADFAANTTVSLDVSVLGSDWAGDNGFQLGFAINSDLTGWQNADIGAWYWGGDGQDFTETVSFDYSALKMGSSCTFVQIIPYQNSYSNDGSMTNAVYYLDNLRLSGAPTPEPATMALLGLGAVILRRKRS